MPEVKGQKKLNQFDRGIYALLAFSMDYATSLIPSPIHDGSIPDTWEIRVRQGNEIDGYTYLVKNSAADYFFPNANKEEIAVKFYNGELDIVGEFQYQVVKTTGGIENYSDIATYIVQESLFDSPVTIPPDPPAEGFFPMYDGEGRLVESLLADNAGVLEFNGSPVGGGGGGGAVISNTAYGVGWDGNTTDGASKNALYDKFEALDAAKQNSLGFTAENTANKSTDINADQASNTKYGAVKAIYNWAVGKFVDLSDARLTNARTPTGGAGGVLGGSYPNPSFAVDMAEQGELDTAVSTLNTAIGTKVGKASGSPTVVNNLWSGSQVQYDALTPDANTIYFIV